MDATSDLRPGQRVLTWGRATYAELAAVPAVRVRAAPVGLSFEELAAIPMAFGTAWHALSTVCGLQPGERVMAVTGLLRVSVPPRYEDSGREQR